MKKGTVGAWLAFVYVLSGFAPALLVGAAPFVLAGCEREGDLEEAGEEIGEEMDDAADDVEDAVD